MKKKNRIALGILRRLCLILVPVLLLPSLSSCQKQDDKEKSLTSLGVDDGVGGFLFNFDTREEVKELLRLKNSGQLPESVSWYYEKGGTAREQDEEVENNYVTAEDPDVIREIYYALSNAIIVGIATDQTPYTHYFISFALPGGKECRYNFGSEGILRLTDQNYVVETDGSLWSVLKEKTEEAKRKEKSGQDDGNTDADEDAQSADPDENAENADPVEGSKETDSEKES